MAGKLRIALGRAEFEYEGDKDFSAAEIESLFAHMKALASVVPLDDPNEAGTADADSTAATKPNGAGGSQVQKLHVNSIATKIDAKTGPEVALAAAAYLQFMEQKETFTRAELLTAMKKATKFYKQTMSSNLTNLIESLLNGKFNQIGEGVYSLTAAEHAALETRLA